MFRQLSGDLGPDFRPLNRYGSPYTELSDTSLIQASHGLTTTIEYSGKGWVSGELPASIERAVSR